MTSKELEKYKEEFEEEFGNNPSGSICKSGIVDNAPDTSDREAWKGISWINYWRALTGDYSTHLKCANCGKDIYVDVDESACRIAARKIGVTPETLQAVGGHFQFNKGEQYFIVPLCKECNNSNVKTLRLKYGQDVVKEIGATVKK